MSVDGADQGAVQSGAPNDNPQPGTPLTLNKVGQPISADGTAHTTQPDKPDEPGKQDAPLNSEQLGLGKPEKARSTAVKELLSPVLPTIVVACVLRAISAVAAIFPFVAVARLGKSLMANPMDESAVWDQVWFGIIALLVTTAFLMMSASLTHLADVDFQLSLRRRMISHLGRVPLGWFNSRSSGQVKKVLQDDVGAMHQMVAHSMVDMVAAAITPLATIIVLAIIDWKLALFALVPTVVGISLYGRMAGGYGEQMAEYDAALGRVNASVIEFLAGISVVKTFGQTEQAHQRYVDETEGFADMFYRRSATMLKPAALSETILSPLFSLAWIIAGSIIAVANGWVEAVDTLPFILLGVGVSAPINALGFASIDLQAAHSAADRIIELLNTPTMESPEHTQSPKGHDVRYQGASFSYDDKTEVLRNINLNLRPGTVTALVGPSGSGKTTIARLLPRFWDPSAGSVLIGGVDIRNIDPAELYRLVGFVFQDVQLLRASVGHNICLGRPDAGKSEMVAAAKAANIHERILALPNGYDTVVGEGAEFSGGEAQRVSIARMFLADTKILVLDEATAFADPESEAEIQSALSQLAVGRTVLVIAHRLSTIIDADNIVVIDKGEIVGSGTHGELAKSSQLYQQLWEAYDGHAPSAPDSNQRQSNQGQSDPGPQDNSETDQQVNSNPGQQAPTKRGIRA